ncbi:hypothetical protein H0H92_007713 [Tricholoma furcatifolium]|nr:hypothetical protein H0H92_007713 [Tricholoma furcatifolium]
MAPDNSEETEFKQIQRNSEFYLSGGDIYFLAENQLFRVHRYFFERESRIFREQIHSSTIPGGPRDGDNESMAIVLDEPASAFEKLLGVFYNPRYSLFDWSVEDWTILLELTQKWEFREVHNLAIRELEKHEEIPLIERIALYQRFEVDQDLLVPLYGQLCSRPEALSDEESEAIGRKATVFIFQARERLRARPSDGGMSPLPAGLEESDVHHTLRALLIPSTSSNGQNGTSLKGKKSDRANIAYKRYNPPSRMASALNVSVQSLVTYSGLVNNGEDHSDPEMLKLQLGIIQGRAGSQQSPIHHELAAKYTPALVEKFRATNEVLNSTVTLLNIISHTPYFIRFLRTPQGYGLAALQAKRMAESASSIDSMPVDDIGEIGQFLSTLLVLQGRAGISDETKTILMSKMRVWQRDFRGTLASETSGRCIAQLGDNDL